MSPSIKLALCLVLGSLLNSLVAQVSYNTAKVTNTGIIEETTNRSFTAVRIGTAIDNVLDSAHLVSSSKSSGFAAVPGTRYSVDTYSAAVSVTAPTSPTRGDRFTVSDEKGTWSTNNCTVSFGNYPLHALVSPDNVYVGNGNFASRSFYYDGTRWLIQ